MEPIEDAELDAFRQKVRTFVEGAAPPKGWRSGFDSAGESERRAFLDEYAAKLRDEGYLAPHWPTEFGGGGLTAAQQLVLKLELQQAEYPPVGGGIAFHHAAATIIKHGTPEQQQALGRILDGEVWCQGFSEPNAGSDLASLQTKAVRDGDEYVINGQKTWSSGALHARWCLLLARTDPEAPKHKGISVFMLDLRLPGIELRPIKQATGASEFCEIFLTDVRVPVDARIGPENEGWKIANTTLATERGSMIIENHASLDRALRELCEEATRTPIGGGRMASDDAAIRAELAQRAAEVEVLGVLAERVVGLTLRHGEMGPESSIIKLFYSEALQMLTELGMRIRGVPADVEPDAARLGYVSGHWMMDHVGSWTWTIAAGSNEIQRNIIAERVLGLPREPSFN
jgi:alkylation response protein AidB-like acyl-CoA dehydrogenase